MSKRKAVAYLEASDPLLLQPHYPIFEGGVKVGRDSDVCEIILSREFVSRRHCALRAEDGGVVVEDLETTNGTFVNGVQVRRQRLNPGDRIGLGKASPHHFIFTLSDETPKRKYVLPTQKVYRIGRAAECDLPLLRDPTVSNRHARLLVRANKMTIEDLGSSSGTFVNGNLVRVADISPVDQVRIGTTELNFQQGVEGMRVTAQTRQNQVRLEARDLVRSHGKLQLLKNINLVIEPGEYVGVLGPSGAGKSTLLNALNGFYPATGGQVLMNGTSLYDSYDMYRNAIGYVPQDDIIHRELSVERSLAYTAQLRLPRDTGPEQLEEQVTSVIETLGLSHVRQSPVLNLSGGQRKRVSIGCELLTKPSLLFLDEPTSGLDPSTEEKLMRHFRQMSEQGQSVVLTTHILYNLDLLDMVILLSRGRLVYFGPTSEVCRHFDRPNQRVERPIDIFDLLEPDTTDPTVREERAEHYARVYQGSQLHKEFVAGRSTKPPKFDVGVQVNARETVAPGGGPKTGSRLGRRTRGLLKGMANVGQFMVLTRRTLDQKLAFPKRMLIPLLTPLVLAILTATLELGDQQAMTQAQMDFEQANPQFLGMLDQPNMPVSRDEFIGLRFQGFGGLAIPLALPLTMVMTAVFLGTLSACLEISGERPIYLRERAVNLGIVNYLGSKLPALFLLSVVQCFMYVACVMAVLHPPGVNVLGVVLICIAVAWVSSIIGLFISSLDPTPGQNSVMLAVIAMLPQMLFSGAMAPAFFDGMHPVTQGVAAILPARWGFELLLTVLYEDPAWARDLITAASPAGMGFGFGAEVIKTNGIALLGLAVAYFVATCISLRRFDKL